MNNDFSHKKVNLILTGLIKEEFRKDSGGIQLSEMSFAESLFKYNPKEIDLTVFARGNGKKISKNIIKNIANNKNFHIKIFNSFSSGRGGIIETWSFSQKVSNYLTHLLLKEKNKKEIIHFTSIGPALAFLNSEFWFFKNNKKIFPYICYTLYNFHYGIASAPYDIFKNYPEEWEFLHKAEKEIISKADYVFVPNFSFINYLKKIFKREIIYLPNTIGEIDDYKTKESLEKDKYILIFSICRLSKEKNLLKAMKAFQLIKKNENMVRYIIAGEGEERNNLISLAKKLSLKYTIKKKKENLKSCFKRIKNNDVVFLGKIEGLEKRLVWNSVDILFLPSLREISPLVGLEALVYGKPIVGSNILGWKDLLELGAVVYLPNPKKEFDLANNLLNAIKKISKEKEKINRIQEKTYKENFSPQVVVPKRIKIYKDIFKGK